jgi:hypothetical protein
MGSWTYVLKSLTTRGKGKGGGGYNLSTGAVSHPPYGSGKKAPKIKTKQQKGKK